MQNLKLFARSADRNFNVFTAKMGIIIICIAFDNVNQ